MLLRTRANQRHVQGARAETVKVTRYSPRKSKGAGDWSSRTLHNIKDYTSSIILLNLNLLVLLAIDLFNHGTAYHKV